MKKVMVKEDTCIGCGACIANYGEIFEFNDGIAHAKKIELSSELENQANEAAEDCPVSAIEIKEA